MNKLSVLLILSPSFLVAGLLDPSKEEMTTPSNCMLDKVFNPHCLKNSKQVWLDGELLLWKASEDGLDYALESDAQNQVQNGKVRSADFEWDWGVRLGIGFKPPIDQWDLFLKYTYIQGRAQSTLNAPANGALFPTYEVPFGLPSNFFAERASMHWEANLHIVDLELGRVCLASRWLSMRPFVGVRGLIIDQDADIEYQGATAAPPGEKDRVSLTNNFWGVGLRMGLDTLWGLGKGWGFFGNAAGALVAGSFNVDEKEKFIPSQQKRFSLSADNDNVTAIAEMALGIQWDYLFSKDRYHFGVKLGWELALFFNQNQLVRCVNANTGSLSSNDGDLSFQGLTLGFRFDF